MKKTLITLSFLLIGLIGIAQTKDSVKVQPKVEFNIEQSKSKWKL